MRRMTHEEAIKRINEMARKDPGLGYMMTKLDLEKELYELKVVDENHVKHIDWEKRYEDLNNFQRRVAEMNLKGSDIRDLLEQAGKYKSIIELCGSKMRKTELYNFWVV